MFVLAGFGSFYLITGENVLTGQKRDSASQVLPAKDVDLNEVNLEISEKEKEQALSPELLLFNEAMAKTTDKSGVRLNSSEKSEAAVFYRFGYDPKSSAYYVAAFASGLSPDKKYVVWLRSDTGKPFKLGVLKELDKSGVMKLGFKTQDSSILDYDYAALTLEETEGEDKESEEFKEDNIVFKSSFNPQEVWGEDAFKNKEESTEDTKADSSNEGTSSENAKESN